MTILEKIIDAFCCRLPGYGIRWGSTYAPSTGEPTQSWNDSVERLGEPPEPAAKPVYWPRLFLFLLGACVWLAAAWLAAAVLLWMR